MKNLFISTLILIGFLVSTGFSTNDPPGDLKAKTAFGEEMVTIMGNQKSYTLELLNLMPEDKFDYRPNEEVRSYAELFKHLAGSFMLQQKVLKGTFTTIDQEFPAVAQLEKSAMSKQQIVDLLSDEFDNMMVLMTEMTEEDLEKTFTFSFIPGAPVKSYQQIFVFSRDHLTHHRGQATTYLRLNGIAPSQYRGW